MVHAVKKKLTYDQKMEREKKEEARRKRKQDTPMQRGRVIVSLVGSEQEEEKKKKIPKKVMCKCVIQYKSSAITYIQELIRNVNSETEVPNQFCYIIMNHYNCI